MHCTLYMFYSAKISFPFSVLYNVQYVTAYVTRTKPAESLNSIYSYSMRKECTVPTKIRILAPKPSLSQLEQMQRYTAWYCLAYGPDMRKQSRTVASAPAITGWIGMRRFRLFLGQCGKVDYMVGTVWQGRLFGCHSVARYCRLYDWDSVAR